MIRSFSIVLKNPLHDKETYVLYSIIHVCLPTASEQITVNCELCQKKAVKLS